MQSNHFLVQHHKNIKVFFSSSFLSTIAVSMQHTMLTTILLSKGISLSELALIQSLFSLSVFLFEIPSGIIADIFSRKNIYIFSQFLYILFYILAFLSYGFTMLAITWIIYGIGNAMSSGTIDSEITDEIKNIDVKTHSNELGIQGFVKRNNKINFVSMIFGSMLGAILFKYIKSYVFLLSAFIIVVAISNITIGYKVISEKTIERKRVIQIIKNGIQDMKSDQNIFLLVLLSGIAQIFFQFHFQFWQALMLKNGFNQSFMAPIYIIFQVISIGAFSFPASSIKLNSLIKKSNLIILLFTASLIAIYFTTSYLLLVFYSFSVFIFTYLTYVYESEFQSHISNEQRSTMTSFLSSSSRICGVLGLMAASLGLKYLSLKLIIVIGFFISIMVTWLLIKHSRIHEIKIEST